MIPVYHKYTCSVLTVIFSSRTVVVVIHCKSSIFGLYNGTTVFIHLWNSTFLMIVMHWWSELLLQCQLANQMFWLNTNLNRISVGLKYSLTDAFNSFWHVPSALSVQGTDHGACCHGGCDGCSNRRLWKHGLTDSTRVGCMPTGPSKQLSCAHCSIKCGFLVQQFSK